MSVVITGSSGQLGQELQALYPGAMAVDQAELDIADVSAVKAFDWSEVEVIFNAAAYTNVDGAETADGKTAARQANVDGVKNLAAVARDRDITLFHVSTDYVFDGTKDGPYAEDDAVNPLGAYGATKAEGDEFVLKVPRHYLVRTSWVIGNGPNFVRTMLKLGAERDELTVVSDQIGRPTFARDLAGALKHLYEAEAPHGIYHFSNDGGPVSWANFARAIFKAAGVDCTVHDTTTAEYFRDKPEAAPRPLNSMLDLAKIKATGLTIRDWQTALADYIAKQSQVR